MRKIEFTKDTLYETEGRGKGPTFKAGAHEDLRDDIAERFVRRGVAVYADGEPPPSPAQPRLPTQPRLVVDPPRVRLPGAGDVEIPSDWQTLPARDVKEIAELLTDPAPTTRNDAHEAIKAELAARDAEVKGS